MTDTSIPIGVCQYGLVFREMLTDKRYVLLQDRRVYLKEKMIDKLKRVLLKKKDLTLTVIDNPNVLVKGLE